MHPEIGNFGLNADYNLWAEFNKELLIRKWINCYRACWINAGSPDKVPSKSIEVDSGNKEERQQAELAMEELIDNGYLSPITYLRCI